jgi:hypothetical protein
MDENDLLFSNEYIPTPVQQDLPAEFNEEFRKYYQNSLRNNQETYVIDKIQRLESQLLDEEFDDVNLMNTNGIANIGNTQQTIKRSQRARKTYVSIDSRDRDKLQYPRANFFKTFLGKTFSNVKSVKLASLEFPNTNAVINNSNNKIYWRNLEDIENDTIDVDTGTYPVYEATIRTGSYILTTLEKEISRKLQSVKRQTTDTFHFADVTLDYDTDICTFRFIDLTLIDANPFSTSYNSNIITVNYTNHPFVVGDTIYIRDSKSFADIPLNEINGSFTVASPDDTSFQIEVNTRAAEAIAGGGGTAVKIGKAAPFQFLFGDNTNTIAENLGFPPRNSADRIDISLRYIAQYYFVEIRTLDPHGITNSFDNVNEIVSVSTNITNVQGNREIIKIVDDYTIIIQPNNPTSPLSPSDEFDNNTDASKNINYAGSVKTVSSIRRVSTNTIYLESYTNHGLDLSDITSRVTFFGTDSKPSIDGERNIFAVIDETSFVIEGTLEINGGVGDTNANYTTIHGVFPMKNPLQTIAYDIDSITKVASQLIIECLPVTLKVGGGVEHTFTVQDILEVGDTIFLNNVSTKPKEEYTYEIASLPGNNTIVVNFNESEITAVETSMSSTVGTSCLFLFLPNHGFNQISSYEGDGNETFEVTTILDHKTENGGSVRIMQTNDDDLNNFHENVEVIDSDTFKVVVNGTAETGAVENTGILGMSNYFNLYNCSSVGGIRSSVLNSTQLEVRKVFDESVNGSNMFLFDVPTGFGTQFQRGGGSSVFISSLKHGFKSEQDNTENDILYRSISLEGEQYAFLTCPVLNTVLSTGTVRDIFARISLTDNPGSIIFDAYLSNPKLFDEGSLPQLSELEFAVKLFDGSFYDFNDLDYSFTLEITEMVDYIENSNISSRRGVLEHII